MLPMTRIGLNAPSFNLFSLGMFPVLFLSPPPTRSYVRLKLPARSQGQEVDSFKEREAFAGL